MCLLFHHQTLMKITPSHPFDLAVYGDYIFWTDWVLQAVVRANKYTGEEVVKLREGVEQLMGIVAVANDTNACVCLLCGLKGVRGSKATRGADMRHPEYAV